MTNDEPNGSGIAYSESDTINTSVEESDAFPGGEKEENKSKEEVTELENEKIGEMIVGGAVDGTRHEEHKGNITESLNTEEKPADTVNFDGEIDASKCNGKEENAQEFINEGSAEDNMTVEAGEKDATEVRNEEKEELSLQHDKDVSAIVEDVMKNREATSTTELNVLVVSESDVKENSMMENMVNQDLAEVEGFTEFPTDALNDNKKEESKDDDVNIAGEVEIAPKKKVKKSKKKVKRKGVVAQDESKSQLLKMHEPVVEVRTNENVKNEENPDVNPNDKVNKSRRVRKKKKKKNAQQSSDIAATEHETDPEPSENNNPAGKEKVAYENENVDHKEDAKSEGSVKKLSKRKRSGKKAAKGNAGEVTAENKDKAEPSKKQKSSKKVGTMGMIFMCNSKTKKDCFHYKILGLPAGKRDMVFKIYEGMRLFLFDVDSRLLYGIYKAAGPGGYNIEPKAFSSGFPSQVRFTILNECLPLQEEKFKTVIKDNYFTKNKFDCQLNPDQVKKLCKLFIATSKGTKSAGKVPRAGTLPISEQQKKRKRAEDDADRERKKKRAQGDAKRDRKKERAQDDAKRDIKRERAQNDVQRNRKKSRAQDDVQRERKMRRARDDGRRSPYTRYSPRTVNSGNPQPVVYESEPYVPEAAPALSYVALPPTVPAYGLSYIHGRTSGVDIYRQDPAIERENRRLTYSGLQNLDEGRSDHYRYTSYSYLDPGHLTSTRQEYYPSAANQEEYIPSSSRTSYYQVPLPPYRQY